MRDTNLSEIEVHVIPVKCIAAGVHHELLHVLWLGVVAGVGVGEGDDVAPEKLYAVCVSTSSCPDPKVIDGSCPFLTLRHDQQAPFYPQDTC